MQALSIAVGGIRAAFQQADDGAARAVRFGTPGGEAVDPAAEAVSRIEAATALKANVAVARTADDMSGTLLDLFA